MKKMYLVFLPVIVFIIGGCVKSPVAELEEKGLKPLTSEQRLETFCNGSFELIYDWGKATMEMSDCNYVWTNQGNGEVYEGTLIESPKNEACQTTNKAKGVAVEPPKKSCNKQITFKTGEKEWKTFKDQKQIELIVKK